MALIQGIVDTQKQNLKSLGIVNSGDDLTIELEVKQNGVNIEFVNPIFELLATKSDGTRVRQLVDITYIGNVVNIIGDEQLVTSPGIVTLQLIIKDNKRSSTCLFYFMCGTSLDRDIIQSISKVEVLNQLDEYVVQAFANLKEYEQRIIASDASIRNLNEDMIKAEKVRVQAEINRGNTFDNLVLKMNNAINAAIATDETLQNNEIKRIDNYNTLKAELESIKDDLILLNNNISKEEEKRVQAEIDRVNKALEIIEKLKSTNDKVTIAEAERVTEFNNIKSELTSLKEALTTINNIANSNEEIRKTNESGRVAAEQQRVTDFEKIKSDNTSLGVALTKKVDDKIVEIEANNNTFKQGINEQYDTIVNKNNTFKDEMTEDFGNTKVDYFGKEHNNVVDRLNSDFDNVHQRINDSSYLEYTGSNITANNTYYGLTKELTVKGRTLQNLCSTNNTITGTPNLSEIFFYNNLSAPWKINTTYTFIFTLTKDCTGDISFRGKNNVPITGVTSYSFKAGINKCTLIATVRAYDEEGVTAYVALRVGAEELTISNFMVLEGDYTNTPINEFPFGEGIYSVGENEVTEDGKYPVKIKSYGKNLFKGELELGGYTGTGGTPYQSTTRVRSINKTDIKKGTYTASCGNAIFVGVNIWSNGMYKKELFMNGSYVTFTVDEASSIHIVCESPDLTKSSIQLEEGTVATEYEPYQESIQELQLTEPLRSLPNGITDEITEDGTEIRRIGKIVLDGSNFDLYSMPTNIENKCRWVIYKNSNVKNISNTHSIATICSDFNSISASDTWMGVTEGIAQNNSGNCLYLFLEKYSSSADYSANKKLLVAELQANPITVYYELAEPIITKHNKNINLKTFDGTTHMTSDNYLQPTISCKVPSNVQAVVMSLKEENEALNDQVSTLNLENENLKTTNDIQDELIDTTMLATDEMYMMIEPLLSEVVQTLSLERSVSKMVDMYVAMVQRGLKTIDEVPARYREQVKEILAQLEK